ncbi:hypothetical protein V2J09_006161 [Rumex salicifolius]
MDRLLKKKTRPSLTLSFFLLFPSFISFPSPSLAPALVLLLPPGSIFRFRRFHFASVAPVAVFRRFHFASVAPVAPVAVFRRPRLLPVAVLQILVRCVLLPPSSVFRRRLQSPSSVVLLLLPAETAVHSEPLK